MELITLLGAGGKMGCRITDNLLHHDGYTVHHVEISPAGVERLSERGISPVDAQGVIPNSDVVILAVPDTAVEAITKDIVPRMKQGALLLTLDPAAPLGGKVTPRDDIAVVIAHPCHPTIFNWEPSEDAFRDFYGGVSAAQAAVVALMQGSEEDYLRGERITRAIYAPVNRVHRLTLEQMAILEPAMVETLAQSCMEVIHEGFEHVVDLGIPREAARDFVLGHLRIQIAVLFGEVNGTFSDAAYKISQRARPLLFQDNWKHVFEMDNIREQVRHITQA